MKYAITIIASLIFLIDTFGKEYKLISPNKTIEVVITIDGSIQIESFYQSQLIFKGENISINIEGQNFSSAINKIRKVKPSSINREIHPVVKEKFSLINEQFNELLIDFQGEYSFTVRAFNEGIAYRFTTAFTDSCIVNSEVVNLEFDDQDSVYFQKSRSFNSSYETPYQHKSIKNILPDSLCNLPMLVKKGDGINILITESDLVDYPGLWLMGTNGTRLISTHAGYPVEFIQQGNAYGQGQVKKHANFIAKVNGSRNFPWRVFAIAKNDGELLTNTLVYQLASPNKIEDVSWITPGVVTFDWWGRRGIYGTDFKSGINTETAKYFIDFASEFDFKYFLFDDGWSAQDDLFQVNPGLDMEEVLSYAKSKNVKIMLWVIWNTFEQQKSEAWDQFEKWGISGIKFDFMNRDDQKMVMFYHEVAEEASKRKMILDFHGAYKPSGLRRTYPNVLTFEALIEFEYNGWTKHVTPIHDNILPYLRMVTGPMDYIPYTTHNAQKQNFRPVGEIPMGQGTRAHSMAQFVIYESPLQMLPDAPSDYYRELECTEFISKIPVEWDDLKVLNAKIGEYTMVARKNEDNWYIGALTDWERRSFDLSFYFLDDGEYHLEYIEDGINADTRAIDYLKKSKTVTKSTSIAIELAPGGGWVGKLMKVK